MTTQEVANRLVELCREGKIEEAVNELYSSEIVSIEPEGSPDRMIKGLEGIAEKRLKFQNMIEKVNSNVISDAIVAENFFSCSMCMNVNLKGVPVAIDMDEICVYTVENGKVIREEFFFTPPPQNS